MKNLIFSTYSNSVVCCTLVSDVSQTSSLQSLSSATDCKKVVGHCFKCSVLLQLRIAVSYTHLDVYKRQGQSSSSGK